MNKFIKLCLAALLLTGCFKKDDGDPETYNLTIKTSCGEVRYNVENAATPEQLQKGLMYRESLPEDGGMIFDLSHRTSGNVAMWMKNTRIPLDMLFLDGTGKIVWIYENAAPYSEELIAPPIPVAFVVELNAGEVRKHNIQTGEMAEHAFIKDDKKKAVAPNELEPKPYISPELNGHIARKAKGEIQIADEEFERR